MTINLNKPAQATIRYSVEYSDERGHQSVRKFATMREAIDNFLLSVEIAAEASVDGSAADAEENGFPHAPAEWDHIGWDDDNTEVRGYMYHAYSEEFGNMTVGIYATIYTDKRITDATDRAWAHVLHDNDEYDEPNGATYDDAVGPEDSKAGHLTLERHESDDRYIVLNVTATDGEGTAGLYMTAAEMRRLSDNLAYLARAMETDARRNAR